MQVTHFTLLVSVISINVPLFVATPSDISCITPQPSDSEITVQSPHPLFEGSSVNHYSLVEPTPSSASYQPILSSNVSVVSSSPAFCQLDVGQPSPFYNPDPSHKLPPNSPHHSHHSPVYRRWSLSSLLDPAQTSRSPPSPYVGHQAKSNSTDPVLHPIAVEPAVRRSNGLQGHHLGHLCDIAELISWLNTTA